MSRMNIFSKRTETVQGNMREEGLDLLILGPTTNAFYFTGLKTYPDERLQLVLIPSSGRPAAILPHMYREKAAEVIEGAFPLLTWSDQQDPLDLVREAAGGRAFARIAVDDTVWASHLLGLMGLFPESAL